MAYGSVLGQTPQIDLSNYITQEQLNSSLEDYATTADLSDMPTVVYNYHIPRDAYFMAQGSTNVSNSSITSDTSWSFTVTNSSRIVPLLLFFISQITFSRYDNSRNGYVVIGNNSTSIVRSNLSSTAQFGICLPLSQIGVDENGTYNYMYTIQDGSGSYEGLNSNGNNFSIRGVVQNARGSVSVRLYGWGGISSAYN